MTTYYRTKRGNYLHCIQGGGQGDGIPRGKLTLVTETFTPQETAPVKKPWFVWVMSEKVTHIKIGPIFEYKSERVS